MTAELSFSASSKALSSEPNSGFSVLYNKLASQISSSSSVSREMNSVIDAVNPQGLSIEKTPTSSNVESATSPPKSHPKPLTLQATEPVDDDDDPRTAPQPTSEELAKLGIKVRDFAYESELPPIPSYRPPRQVQTGPRPLKRTRLDEEEDEDLFQRKNYETTWGQSSSATELLPIDTSNLPRTRGFADLSSYDHVTDSQPLPHSQQSEWCSPSHSQLPLEYIDSQGSEPYISTPLVTPNGSLQWQAKDTSSVPASQLDVDRPLADSEVVPEPQPLPGQALPSDRGLLSSPRVPISELALPQLSFPKDESQIQRHFSRSPSRSPSPALLENPSPPKKKQRAEPSASPCPPKSSSPPDKLASPPPRYHLRTRRASAKSPSLKPASRSRPPSRSQKNGKLAPPPAGLFSVRSVHSQTPNKSQGSRMSRARKKSNGMES